MERLQGVGSWSRRRLILTSVGLLMGIVVLSIILSGRLLASDDDQDRIQDPVGTALGGNLNYVPVDSTGELSRRMKREIPESSLIVRATVEGYESGRAYLTEPGLPSYTNVLALGVDKVYGGRLPEAGDGRIYLELDGTSETEHDLKALAANVPVGTELVAYLWRMPAGGIFPGVRQRNADAGRPEGQPLYRPYPPGLFVEDRELGSVIAPFDGVEYRGVGLSEFAPSGDIDLSAGTPLEH